MGERIKSLRKKKGNKNHEKFANDHDIAVHSITSMTWGGDELYKYPQGGGCAGFFAEGFFCEGFSEFEEIQPDQE